MRLTNLARKIFFAAPLLLLLLVSAQPGMAADKLQQVLAQLDNSAKNVHSASADFEYKNIQTVPVPDVDVMSGTVYYEHKGEVRLAFHVKQRNGQAFEETYTYNRGVFELFQKNLNQVTKYRNAGNLSSYFMLSGFGYTGKELMDGFEVSYLGEETIDGVKTEKLQLIPKDAKLRDTFPKISIWVDPTRDVSLKQVFDEGQGLSRVATFTHIELNHSISSSEFAFKTNRNTQFTTQ